MKGNIRRREINIPETPFFQPYFCQAEHIMIYTEVVSFDLNGVQIKTTVTNELKVLDEHISSFLQPTDNNRTKVIGFDMEWRPPFMLEPAIFQLCDGNSCLIFHLHPKISVPLSLRNFLRQPNYTFVGCGIKDDFEYLKKHSGIGCKNAVELGTLAATLMDKPHLGFCGVDELAFVVNKLDLHKYRPLNLAFDWDSYPLSEELAKLATVNVYSYHKIGSALFERQSYEASPLSIPLLQRSSGDESITLGPQGGLARGMSSRGPAAVSSVGGPNGYSNLSERASYSPREDLTPRYVPNRFAGPTAYDQSSAPEHSVNYRNRDLGSADRFLDRPVVNPPPARAQETALSQNTSFEKGLSEEKLQKMSMAAIKEYYSARDVNEVVLCVKDLNSPSFHPSMVYHWVTDSFERKDTERDLLAKLLIDLVKSHDGWNLF
ncbi:unnamed protein product [Trifolium pratense]|uniref:Uncharacterized protein n=1 Tax=Trifolium pratense TaxID=57577 RepID=A0ACB0LS32_TRIPR|nr:unnamed protein product [Trifolium pratense]